MFLWTDLETTGLDPTKHVPLSIGIVITDDMFREFARREWDIYASPDALADMDPFVRDMHTKNGLLERVATAQCLAAVEFEVGAWLRSQGLKPGGPIKERPPYAGNTVHFDQGFITRHMPALAEFYNYRCLDVSTLKVIASAIVPGAKAWDTSRPDAAHTPLKDLDGSLAEFAHWRRVLFNEQGFCRFFKVTHAGPPLTGSVPSTYEPCTLLPGHMPPCK